MNAHTIVNFGGRCADDPGRVHGTGVSDFRNFSRFSRGEQRVSVRLGFGME